MKGLSGDDGPMGTRLLFKETAKITASLEQKIEVLEERLMVYDHAFKMIGMEMKRAGRVLNNLKGE